MTHLQQALDEFTAYQQANNAPKYARVTSARVGEFIAFCSEHGVADVCDINPGHICNFLYRTPLQRTPGAWRSRYTAIMTFCNYMVLVGVMTPEQNPTAGNPIGATLTNKPMLALADIQRLLLTIPPTHQGFQDRLCTLLSWHGRGLVDINALTLNDIPTLPPGTRELAERLQNTRQHLKEKALFISSKGVKQTIHGQKLNRRLQQYATLAGLDQPERITASLIKQSGTVCRMGGDDGGKSQDADGDKSTTEND